MGSKEADRVIAPVISQAPLHQAVVVHELVHRHELHHGDPQSVEMVDHRGWATRRKCPDEVAAQRVAQVSPRTWVS